ncbi:hypothetical protein E4U42_007940 [Claviceps africana]|uniref:Uncharacterized protein n=1 Tax=Claviceps africana TaxID=83212 RepID=A0A8K0JAL6_9HYPO|nr:hypothetical protein E4U42_007940 [Claviceps africana]
MAQQYGYGGRQNPYDQRDNAPGGYGRQQQSHQPYQQPQPQPQQQQQQQGGFASGGGYGQNNAYGGKSRNPTAVSLSGCAGPEESAKVPTVIYQQARM